jgi:hypothetical protein
MTFYKKLAGMTAQERKETIQAHLKKAVLAYSKKTNKAFQLPYIIPSDSIRFVCARCEGEFDVPITEINFQKTNFQPLCPDCLEEDAQALDPPPRLSRVTCVKCRKRFDIPFEPSHTQGSFEYFCIDCKEPSNAQPDKYYKDVSPPPGLSRVICLGCGCLFNTPKGPNPNAHCSECTAEMLKPKPVLCLVCNKEIEGYWRASLICKECSAKKKCPVCTTNLIPRDQSVCDACSKKITQEQNSKPKEQKPKPKVGQRKVIFDDVL